MKDKYNIDEYADCNHSDSHIADDYTIGRAGDESLSCEYGGIESDNGNLDSYDDDE